MRQADAPRVHVERVAQWEAWLAEHHAERDGVWVVWWKRGTGRPAPSYEELICETLRWGWIDSTAKRVDDERTMMWFSPRKPSSGWSRPNKQRLARLEAEGLMQPAGVAAVAAAKAGGSWTLLDDVEDLVVPDDLATALDERGARAGWDALPASARKVALTWLVQARRSETRARRRSEIADRTAAGERPR